MLAILIFIAAIQGITEFLPVSSSAHLAILAKFFNFETPATLLFFLVVHTGTAVAALYYFRNDIFEIVRGFLDFLFHRKTQQASDSLKWLFLIFMVSLPTAVAGIAFKDQFQSFSSYPIVIPCALILTSIILFSSKFIKSKSLDLHSFTYSQAFLVGVAQSCALIPGISRSGSTIAVALFLGASPLFAGKLSFLASFVAIFGAFLMELVDVIQLNSITMPFYYFFIAFVVSFLVGLWALRFLIAILDKGKIYLFSFYCFFLGFSLLVLYFMKIWI